MISMAGPAASDTARTACSRKARLLAWSAGTVVARAELTVGAAAMGIQGPGVEFRLLVNVERAGVGGGIAPGGLLSAGTGAWPPAGVWPVPPAGAVLPAAAGVPVLPAGSGDLEPPHAASAATSPAAARARPELSQGASRYLLFDMPTVVPGSR